MKWLLAGPMLILLSVPASAESVENALRRDVPGWEVSATAEGDLNKDGHLDAVAILYKAATEPGAHESALIVVFLGDENGNLRLQTKAPHASCVGCGGMKASPHEPLGDPEIDAKGILNITYMGGALEEWEIDSKWRWDPVAKDLLLIGETESMVDTVGKEPSENLDVNYSTLKADRTVGNKKTRCGVPKSMKGQPLATFEFGKSHFEALQRIKQTCR
jgi:hypothetical protein